MNPKIVAERLGHASVALTLNIYSHVIPDMQAQATQQITEALFPEAGTHEAHNEEFAPPTDPIKNP